MISFCPYLTSGLADSGDGIRPKTNLSSISLECLLCKKSGFICEKKA